MRVINGFRIPETWADVTPNNMLAIIYLEDASRSDASKVFEIVKIFNPDKDVMSLSFNDISEIAETIAKLIGSQPQSTQLIDAYKVKGKTYKIVKPDEIDLQQYIDVTTLNSKELREQLANLPLIVSVLTDEVADKLEWAKMVAEYVDIETLMGVVLFFSSELAKYTSSTLLSSLQKEIEEIKIGKTK